MLQFIWKHYPKTRVSFSLLNRSTSVRLADMFPREELIHQMEHVRGLPVSQVGTGLARRQHVLWPPRNL